VEPVEVGTPGAYVARVVSKMYTKRELDELQGTGRLPTNLESLIQGDKLVAGRMVA
jgi:hypothetical protein